MIYVQFRRERVHFKHPAASPSCRTAGVQTRISKLPIRWQKIMYFFKPPITLVLPQSKRKYKYHKEKRMLSCNNYITPLSWRVSTPVL